MTASMAAAQRYIVFEGLDGVGKTTFSRALGLYLGELFPESARFVGPASGMGQHPLGSWIYSLRHGRALGLSWSTIPDFDAVEMLTPHDVSGLLIELLHAVAHVETIRTKIQPALDSDGFAVVDRYWWSTYAFARLHLDRDSSLASVQAELVHWKRLPIPTVFYLTRAQGRLDRNLHREVDGYYREAISSALDQNVYIVENNGRPLETWATILDALGLPVRAPGFPVEALDDTAFFECNGKPKS
jgi:thymidylate kinase